MIKMVLIGVGIGFGTLLLILVVFLAYMGMFKTMTVTEKEMGPYTVVYESFVGPYKETGPIFDKVYKELKAMGISTKLGFGIYYDNPSEVAADKLRSDCGAVLEEKYFNKLEDLKKKFKVVEIKKQPGLVTEFPIKNMMSFMFGPMKAYPALDKYAKSKNYSHDSVGYELYDETQKKTFYIMPFVKK